MTNSEEQQTKELLRSYLSSSTTDNSGTPIAGQDVNSKIDEYPWAPDAEEIIQLFEQLKKNRYINFNWQCAGRRKPHEVHEPEPEKVLTNVSRRVEVETDDFDFDEESPAPSMVRCRPSKGAKKVNKKPVSLAGILSNMERHRIMDEMEVKQSSDSTK